MATKVSEADKSAIEAASTALKAALQGEDVEAIKAKTNDLMQAQMKLGEAMYKLTSRWTRRSRRRGARRGQGRRPSTPNSRKWTDDKKKSALIWLGTAALTARPVAPSSRDVAVSGRPSGWGASPKTKKREGLDLCEGRPLFPGLPPFFALLTIQRSASGIDAGAARIRNIGASLRLINDSMANRTEADVAKRDFYETLGVAQTATEAELKAAFR